MRMRWRSLRALALCGVLAGVSACGRSTAPDGLPGAGQAITIPLCVSNGQGPVMVGPIPSAVPGDRSHDYPWLASNLDLAAHGYVEEEYFVCGNATGGAYTTRLIVRRPRAAAAYNGTVLAEWLNVTLGYDLDALWQLSHEHIMKAGYVYVGISAQRSGIYDTPNGLQAWSPKRYAQLSIPQGSAMDGSFVFDPAAYDIYGQALRLLRQPGAVDPLGGLPVRWLVAAGASQSAGTITLYYDLFQRKDNVADGFLPFLLSLSSLMAALGYDQQVNVDVPTLTAAVGKPLFLVNTETDPSFAPAPDSDLFRLWETAGATHLDEQGVQSLRPLVLRDLGVDLTASDALCQYTPRSRIPFHQVLNAAMDRLLAWLQNGTPPPHGTPFQYDATGQLVRDGYGNVLGGIRLSQHAVATAVNRRDNSGGTGCNLEGQYQPFDAATLRRLYPTHDDYVSRVVQVTEQNLSDGYINDDDARATMAAAQSAAVPP